MEGKKLGHTKEEVEIILRKAEEKKAEKENTELKVITKQELIEKIEKMGPELLNEQNDSLKEN